MILLMRVQENTDDLDAAAARRVVAGNVSNPLRRAEDRQEIQGRKRVMEIGGMGPQRGPARSVKARIRVIDRCTMAAPIAPTSAELDKDIQKTVFEHRTLRERAAKNERIGTRALRTIEKHASGAETPIKKP